MRTLADVSPGQHYRHHRGGFYWITCISRSAENPDQAVIAYRRVGAEPGFVDWHHAPEDFLLVFEDGTERFSLSSLEEVLRSVNPKDLESSYFNSEGRMRKYRPAEGPFQGEHKIQGAQ